MDWESPETHVLLNPRLEAGLLAYIKNVLPTTGDFASHLWLMTSGSTSGPDEYKCVALSKKSILASAEAVNAHLNVSSSDVWLNPLPLFHVGGLGISARAHLSGAKSVDFFEKWDADIFYRYIVDHAANLTALVPTQLHDLIVKGYAAPKSMRAVIIGGGALDASLYQKARNLGWPVLSSYGLTEAASQVATQSSDSHLQALRILNHVQVRVDASGFIVLKGSSLLTAYAYLKRRDPIEIVDPKHQGWFRTEDRGEIRGDYLEIFGRGGDFIKVGGENVNLSRLERLLQTFMDAAKIPQPVALLGVPDERLGKVVHLVVEGAVRVESHRAIDQFQKAVLPFERIRRVHVVEKFPRTELGKIQKNLLIGK